MPLAVRSDGPTDIVQQRRGFEPFPFRCPESMNPGQLVEESKGQCRHMPNVLRLRFVLAHEPVYFVFGGGIQKRKNPQANAGGLV